MSEELKPCPFCGGHATIGGIVWPNAHCAINVACDVCFVHTINYDNKQKAIDAWNRRVNNG